MNSAPVALLAMHIPYDGYRRGGRPSFLKARGTCDWTETHLVHVYQGFNTAHWSPLRPHLREIYLSIYLSVVLFFSYIRTAPYYSYTGRSVNNCR